MVASAVYAAGVLPAPIGATTVREWSLAEHHQNDGPD
jgi:hypothetical protein